MKTQVLIICLLMCMACNNKKSKTVYLRNPYNLSVYRFQYDSLDNGRIHVLISDSTQQNPIVEFDEYVQDSSIYRIWNKNTYKVYDFKDKGDFKNEYINISDDLTYNHEFIIQPYITVLTKVKRIKFKNKELIIYLFSIDSLYVAYYLEQFGFIMYASTDTPIPIYELIKCENGAYTTEELRAIQDTIKQQDFYTYNAWQKLRKESKPPPPK